METKKVSFCCPEHGLISGPVEYISVDIGNRRLVDVPVKFCSACQKYYTPYSNLLALIKLHHRGCPVLATALGCGKDMPREDVRVPYYLYGQAVAKKLYTDNKFCRKATHGAPKERIKGYYIIQLKHVYMGSCKKQFALTNYICDECLYCGNKLIHFINFARLNDTEGARIPGQYCSQCDIFFESNGTIFKELHSYLPDRDEISIDEQFLIPDYSKRIQYARSKKSAAIAIHLKNKSTGAHRLITIVASRSDKDNNSDVRYYGDRLAREILYEVYKGQKTIAIAGEEYDLHKVLSLGDKNTDIVNRLKITKIVLRKGGGIYQGIKEEGIELVDVLMYSPFTGCLEIAHASYDPKRALYYMDINVFRDFVAQYGNPGVTIAAYHKGKTDFLSMRDESILHAYGYKVGKSGLSDRERQVLLAEVLDLGIMTLSGILSLLNLNISTHPEGKYPEANADWETDKRFVMEYKINPERFVVATIGLR